MNNDVDTLAEIVASLPPTGQVDVLLGMLEKVCTERNRLRAVLVDAAHDEMGGPELVAGVYEFPLAPGLSTRFGFCPVCRMVWPPDGTHECQEDT